MTAPNVIDDRPEIPGLVSVIIPTFNRAYIIGHAIESVLGQSYPRVEVIVADDGSTDGTREIIEHCDTRVRYVRQENSGPSAARNLGLRLARSEFVAFLDSDDEWLPWKLELQVALLRRLPEAGMVWTDMTAVDELGHTLEARYLRKMYNAYTRVTLTDVMRQCGVVSDLNISGTDAFAERSLLTGDIFQYMLLGSLVHTSTVLLRRSRVRQTGGFDESLKPSGEDYEFHLRTCFEGPVAFADVASIRYRVGADDQLTAQRYMIHVARNNVRTLDQWLMRGSDRITSLSEGQVRHSLSNAHAWLGSEEFEAGNRAAARRHLWKSVRLGPASARTIALLALSLCPAVLSNFVLSLYRAVRRPVASNARH
jgi:glycosyltransferase involved in cell wall biosynthesis